MPMPPPPPPPPPSAAKQDGEAGGVARRALRWYRRRPRVLQWVMGAGVVVVALSVVGALIGDDEDDDTAPVTTTTVDLPCDPAYKSPPCVPHRDGGDVDCSDVGYRVYLHDPSDDPHNLDSGWFTGDGRGCRDQPEHPSNATTTTTPPTTTTTTTTTAPATTTTVPTTTTTGAGTSDSELTASEKACADNWETISHAEMLRMKRDRSIDGIHDWSGGYWVSYEKIMDLCEDLTRAAPTTTTTTLTRTVQEIADGCLSPWGGNHNGFERLVRQQLNDPGSMETHGTYFNPSDDLADNRITLRMDYGARNVLGGMVRTNAVAEMDIETCEIVAVIDYGFG